MTKNTFLLFFILLTGIDSYAQESESINFSTKQAAGKYLKKLSAEYPDAHINPNSQIKPIDMI